MDTQSPSVLPMLPMACWFWPSVPVTAEVNVVYCSYAGPARLLVAAWMLVWSLFMTWFCAHP